MNHLSLDLNRGKISVRKIFWIVVIFEFATILAILYGDPIFWAYYAGIIITPFLLLLIPVEPVIGIMIMFLATGLDILGRIADTDWSFDFAFTYFHIALFITFFSTFLNLVLKHRTTIRSINLWLPLITFYIIIAFSLIYTPDFTDGSTKFLRVIVMGLITLIVIECLDREWKINTFIWGMVLFPVGISILTIYQLLTEGAFYPTRIVKMATSLGFSIYRSTGTFDNPNTLACFLMIGIVAPFSLLFIKKLHPLIKLVLISSLAISSIGILSSFSRSGWLSTLVALLFIVVLHKKWSYLGIFIGIVAIVAIVLSFKIPQLWEVVFSRFGSIFDPLGDDSTSSRISLMKSGIWMWQDNPIFGVGFRGFPALYDNYVDPNMPYYLREVNEPHTLQIEVLAELGLIGLIVTTWLFITIIFHGLFSFKRIKNEFLRNAQIACTALIIGFLANFVFATDIVNNAFWMIVGVVYAIPFFEGDISSQTIPVTADDS